VDNDLLFDDVLKEKARNENLKLPKEIDLKIKETISNLPDRKKSKKRFAKRAGIAAAIALITITTLSAAFPAYARNLPIIGSVFDFLSEKNIIYRDYVEYSSDLNLSKVSNGVKVTINEIVYDGIDLSIAYTVESKEKMNSEPHIMDKNIRINGKEVTFASGGTGKFIDENTYIGIDSFSVDRSYISKEMRKNFIGGDVEVPDNFTMDLDISEFSNGIYGKWDFKFKVSNDKLEGKIVQIDTSIDLSEIRPSLEVTEVIFTPINTVLRTVEDNSSIDFIDNFIVLDDKGRLLEFKSSEGNGSTKLNKTFFEHTFKNIYEDTNSVTFIPVKYREELSQNNYDEKEVLLNNYGTTILSQGEIGEYKVTEVEFLEDKTLIHYECTNFLATKYPYSLKIVDSKGKEYKIRNFKEKDDGSFIGEIGGLSKEEQYKLVATDFEDIYEIREDLKFTIEVK